MPQSFIDTTPAIPSPTADLDRSSTVVGLKDLGGQTLVIKFGGSALLSKSSRQSLIAEAGAVAKSGMKVVVVHGGGPSVDAALSRLGIPIEKIDGLRVTDATTIRVVVDVLSNINKELVKDFEAIGAMALAVDGTQNNVFLCKKLLLKDKEGAPIDLGWVGDIQGVDLFAISRSLDSGHIPVVAPIGMDNEGDFYNINADHATLAVASALQANHLLFLTDVPGVLQDVRDPASRIPQLSERDIESYIRQGIISGGMLPKLSSCLSGIKKGIGQISIVDGRLEQAIIRGIITPTDIGTLIEDGKK